MATTNLVITACLSTWSTLVVPVLAEVEGAKGSNLLENVPAEASDLYRSSGNYTICDSDVCKQRARLINASLDRCIDPCEDFYSYACGGWIQNHTIPPSKSSTGTFNLLRDELQETLKRILENMTLVYECQNVTDKAAVAYNACMAVPTSPDRRDVMLELMNASGVVHWPITNETQKVFENSSEVLHMTGISAILSFNVGRDIKMLNSNIIALDQLSFGTVGRNQLIHPEKEENKKIIKAYKYLIETALKFIRPDISEEDLARLSQEIIIFEGQLANMTAPPEERRNIMQIYNRTTIAELQENFTSIPLLDLLQKEFTKANVTLSDNETVELYALNYYQKLDYFLRCTADPTTLYNYAGLKVMLGFGAQVSATFRNASLELNKAISGVVTDKPTWDKCVGTVNNLMPEIVGLLYVEQKFSKQAKKEVEDLAKRLMEVFNETLQNATWMDNVTRAAAEEKLVKMGTKIGYPHWLYNTTYLEELYQFVPEICRNCSFAQVLYWLARNNWIQEILKLRQPYDQDKDWFVGPAVVNAFYNPSSNEMVYPSGILQGVFYEHGLPRSINYGAIGMVVGHEMTHGFDDEGSQFDAYGALKQWWSKDTRKHFEQKAECFISQYGNITDTMANMSLNGQNTVGENIADNGGLRLAFEAFDKLLEEQCENDTRLWGLENITAKQLFFIGHAMVWCSNSRPEYVKQQIQYDPHSPDQYRVNVPMQNLQAFSKIFGCSSNSTMNPKDRCSLW
uniref:Putative m13 family peptidase n=1 Tax=Amblyomma triste TaxID=251400 RepID=A0A023GNH8_AMBTT